MPTFVVDDMKTRNVESVQHLLDAVQEYGKSTVVYRGVISDSNSRHESDHSAIGFVHHSSGAVQGI